MNKLWKATRVFEHFIPAMFEVSITDSDRKKFVEWSSNGLHRAEAAVVDLKSGFSGLVFGKQRADILVSGIRAMIREGTYHVWELHLEEDMHEYVREYIRKSL
jgi:hypothetical protein